MEHVAHRPIRIGRQTYHAGEHFSIQEYFGRQLLRDGKAYEAVLPPVQVNAGLVSCIMPTKDRAAWIPRTLNCWQKQTYQPLQLVVIDNGARPIKDILPDDRRIIYARTGQGMRIGMLRNLACSVATGEFIAHWDDDDWYSPERIERQVKAIGDAQMCALRTCLFDEPGTVRRYESPPNHAIGASFLYRRDWWMKNRFAGDVHVGEDAMFFGKIAKAAVLLDGDDLLVASIHEKNTSPRTAKTLWAKTGTLPEGYTWV